jgi:hypothetical protein
VRSGTIKRMRADADTAAANLDQALTELTTRSGVSMQAIARTCIGTAGNTVPLVTDYLLDSFAARVSGQLILLGDVEIALDAAFCGGPGVLLLAGTGSNVTARTNEGRRISAWTGTGLSRSRIRPQDWTSGPARCLFGNRRGTFPTINRCVARVLETLLVGSAGRVCQQLLDSSALAYV